MKHLAKILFVIALTGCSAYQSDGRKFLESQAIEFAGTAALANQTSCNRDNPDAKAWVRLDQTEQAVLYAYEGETYSLRVQTKQDEGYNCYYQFASAQEMYQKSESAVAITLQSLANTPLAATPKTSP